VTGQPDHKPPPTQAEAAAAAAATAARKKRARARKRRHYIEGTIGLLTAAIVGWVVSLILTNATSSVSLSASNASVSGTAISFVVVNSGAKAATHCSANVTFSRAEFRAGTRTVFSYNDEPVVPANGTETFTIGYVPANAPGFALATVWASCNGVTSQRTTLIVREPFMDGR
jgi:hypothetical protein